MQKYTPTTIPTFDAYKSELLEAGWAEGLIDQVITVAGGYDSLLLDVESTGQVIFTNSLAPHPDLVEDEPCTVSIEALLGHHSVFADETNMEALLGLFAEHEAIIPIQIKHHFSLISDDAHQEFEHLAHEVDTEGSLCIFEEGRVDEAYIPSVMLTIYYLFLLVLNRMQGGMDATRLLTLDLSNVTSFYCKDVNVNLTKLATKKINGFLNDTEDMQGIVDDNKIHISYGRNNTINNVAYVAIMAKSHSYLAQPIQLALGPISYLDVSGDACVTANIINKKESVDIYFDDHSISDVYVDVKTEIDVRVMGHARLVLSGQATHSEITATDNSVLLAARFSCQYMPVLCDGQSLVMANSANFSDCSRNTDLDATVINTEVTYCSDPVAYQRYLDEGGEPDNPISSRVTRATIHEPE